MKILKEVGVLIKWFVIFFIGTFTYAGLGSMFDIYYDKDMTDDDKLDAIHDTPRRGFKKFKDYLKDC